MTRRRQRFDAALGVHLRLSWEDRRDANGIALPDDPGLAWLRFVSDELGRERVIVAPRSTILGPGYISTEIPIEHWGRVQDWLRRNEWKGPRISGRARREGGGR